MHVNGDCVAQIDRGCMVLVGFTAGDTAREYQALADKIIHLRIFPNDQGKFDKSLLDIEGALLIVPQFTLYAGVRKGRRPDFSSAMNPTEASSLFDEFMDYLSGLGLSNLQQGVFGADMKVSLINDGPVTIIIDSEDLAVR